MCLCLSVNIYMYIKDLQCISCLLVVNYKKKYDQRGDMKLYHNSEFMKVLRHNKLHRDNYVCMYVIINVYNFQALIQPTLYILCDNFM